MAQHTKIQVSINGNQLSVVESFSLNEKIGDHASFSIATTSKYFDEDNVSNVFLENTKDFIGKICLIELTDIKENSERTLRFKGIVTNLKSIQKSDQGNFKEGVLITGNSTSIILENGAQFKSYSESSLSDIIATATQDATNLDLNLAVSPEDDPQLLYSVQQNQSTFQYIKQLAAKYGEFLLYGTDTLYFGKPSLGSAIPLKLNGDLKNINFGLTSAPGSFTYISNDYYNEEVHQASSNDVPLPNNPYINHVDQARNALYPTNNQISFNAYDDTQLQARMTKAMELQKKVSDQNLVSLSGSSYHPGVSLGKEIEIQGKDSSLGTYRVISVNHFYNGLGSYSNTFAAIPITTDAYPLTSVNSFTRSDSQIAKVFDNVDPEGLSRIKVQFPWQVATNQTTPWIRVMTPHSGADKGFYFIPEIGEEIIAGFEGGNAEKPYVMGALYTGVNKPESWQTDANNIKAIRTLSGHTIELNDTEGEEKIRIYDNKGSVIEFNTKEKTLNINATENLNLVAKNINIRAEEKVNITSEQEIELVAEQKLTALSNDQLQVQSSGDTSVKSKGNLALEATSDATVTGVNAIIEGTASAEINAAEVKLKGSAMAEVAGAIVKLN